MEPARELRDLLGPSSIPERAGWEPVRALVTVKAYPQLSQNYGETVCVAGVRLDRTPVEWIRIFPVPFRDLRPEDQFEKYRVIEFLARRSSDPRPESWLPDLSTLRLLEHVDTDSGKWTKRRLLLEPLLPGIPTCDLLTEARANGLEAPSLGMVKPKVEEITVEVNGDFTADKRALAALVANEDLFGIQRDALEPAPYTVKLHYKCGHDSCFTHHQNVIDWEFGALARRLVREGNTEEQCLAKLAAKAEQLLSPDRDVYIFIGNQRRNATGFLVLGFFYPTLPPRVAPGLF